MPGSGDISDCVGNLLGYETVVEIIGTVFRDIIGQGTFRIRVSKSLRWV